MFSKALKGKTVILTGIGGGIGVCAAQRLMNEEAKVIGISSKPKKNLPSTILKHENLVEVFSCNFQNLEDLEFTLKIIKEKYKCPDVIINNAALFHFKKLEDLSIKEISSAFNVNIIGPMMICKFFVKSMKSNKLGYIINICSSSSYNGGGTPGHTLYGSTKHSLLGFSRALDEELRKYNVRVGTISPAGVNTNMIRDRNDINKNTIMSVDEVVDALFYLLNSTGKGIVYEMRLWRMLR